MQIRKKQLENSLSKRLDDITHPKTFFVEYKGIKFKSTLEKDFYVYANEELGYDFKYEEFQTTLLPKETLECFVYAPIPKSKFLDKRTNLQHITKIPHTSYSPDFHTVITNKNGEKIMVCIEVKGRLTDGYNIKKKMFIALMNKKYGTKIYFFEPHNMKQFKQVFTILKDL